MKHGILAVMVLAVLVLSLSCIETSSPCANNPLRVYADKVLSPGEQFFLTTPAADKKCVHFELYYHTDVQTSQTPAGDEHQLGDLSNVFHVDRDNVTFPHNPPRLQGQWWKIEFNDHGDYSGNVVATSATYYIKFTAPQTLTHAVRVKAAIGYLAPPK